MPLTRMQPTRLDNICKIPSDLVDVVKSGIDSVVGALAAVVFIPTCGRFEAVNKHSKKFENIDDILRIPLCRIATIVNPRFEIGDNTFSFEYTIMAQGMKRDNAKENESFFVRHVVVRIVEAVVGTLATIGALADSILGLVAWVPVILTAGYFIKLNTYAVYNTQLFGITRLVETVKRVVNPYYDCKS